STRARATVSWKQVARRSSRSTAKTNFFDIPVCCGGHRRLLCGLGPCAGNRQHETRFVIQNAPRDGSPVRMIASFLAASIAACSLGNPGLGVRFGAFEMGRGVPSSWWTSAIDSIIAALPTSRHPRDIPMSYLDTPRFHFRGQFFATPSTINNSITNFDTTVVYNNKPESASNPTAVSWNPNGAHFFKILPSPVAVTIGPDGTEFTTKAADPLVGATIQSL